MNAPRRKLISGIVSALVVVLGLVFAASLRSKPITSRAGILWAGSHGGTSRSEGGTGIGGVLEKDDRGCLVVTFSPGVPYMVIWPRGTRWTGPRHDAVQVGDNTVLAVGAEFEGGGTLGDGVERSGLDLAPGTPCLDGERVNILTLSELEPVQVVRATP